MKMAKATRSDIEAAGDAMSVLNDISNGYYPSLRQDDETKDRSYFDPDSYDDLRKFYDLMQSTLNESPGWPGRVIGGMCFVILYGKNQIVDPDTNTLELHPRFAAVEAQRDELLEALKEVAETFGEDWRDGSTQRRLGDKARAAIAKAKGGAA